MDDARNPFDQRHGAVPPALVGRTRELAAIDVLLGRLATGAPTSPLVLSGRAGVGKSALLDAARDRAAAHDWYAGLASADAGDSLREPIAQAFARALSAFAARRPGAAVVRGAADAIAGFSPRVLAELPGSVAPEAVAVPRGDFTRDLRTLLSRVGDGFRDLVGRGLVIAVDDLHRADPGEVAVVLRTFTASMRDGLPIAFLAAGSPTVAWMAREAATDAEVLDVMPLPAAEVAALVRGIAAGASVTFDDDALTAIAKATAGYPALVLLYARTAWNAADGPASISAADVARGAPAARDLLGRTVLAPSFAVAPAARRYLRTVAEADDPADSAVIAQRLGDTTRFGSGSSQMTELRDSLVRAGLLTNLDGSHITFVHPAARSYVLSWE